MKQIIAFKMKLLYLYGALLYAVLAVVFIFSLPDIALMTKNANQFLVDGQVKLYWGLLFGPAFMLFSLYALGRALMSKRDFKTSDWIFMAWLVVDIIALSVGVLRGNSLRYLLSDTFVFAVIPLAYFLVKNQIKDYAQVKSFFYFMLVVQFIIIIFPVDWGIIQPYESVPFRIGLYGYHSTEAVVTTSLMTLGLLGKPSKNRFLFLGLFVIALLVSLSRTRTIFMIQIFLSFVLLFFVHKNKLFIKRAVVGFCIISLGIFITMRSSDLFKKVYFFQTHHVSMKAGQMYLLAKEILTKRSTDNSRCSKKSKGPSISENKQFLTVAPTTLPIKIEHPRWTVYETGAFGKESTKSRIGSIGLSLKNQRNDAGPYYAQLRISDEFERFALSGHTLTFGCWVYATDSRKVYIGIVDNVNGHEFNYSSYHSGSGRWEFLTVSKVIRSNTETVNLQLFTQAGSIALFDGAIVFDGQPTVNEMLSVLNADSDLLERFQTDVMKDVSLNERYFESKAVLDKFKNQNFWTFLFGFGNGATVDLSRTPDITMRVFYKGMIHAVHAIHFLPLALLSRQGVIGVLFFLVFCAMIIIKFIKWMPWFRSEEDDAIITEIFFLSVFVILLAGFTATPHFFSSITAGFSIGLISVMERLKEDHMR
ncbi:hypothetical protein BU251_04320 [Candidatus Velamenicoccus archaeovorus]|uniref:Uncharacterized protein n=1 Tax=Velamenicoccus archaeovorus TaxID=1930593 RepID=A0A410P4G0_VELA1|nr:hypothetical protein [Candidatus Velamenicoccus archaeovorus]QAT17013.1 hypothetical protein BU251_04320 [Candidatus Velamenicoccus archaeovorus]